MSLLTRGLGEPSALVTRGLGPVGVLILGGAVVDEAVSLLVDIDVLASLVADVEGALSPVVELLATAEDVVLDVSAEDTLTVTLSSFDVVEQILHAEAIRLGEAVEAIAAFETRLVAVSPEILVSGPWTDVAHGNGDGEYWDELADQSNDVWISGVVNTGAPQAVTIQRLAAIPDPGVDYGVVVRLRQRGGHINLLSFGVALAFGFSTSTESIIVENIDGGSDWTEHVWNLSAAQIALIDWSDLRFLLGVTLGSLETTEQIVDVAWVRVEVVDVAAGPIEIDDGASALALEDSATETSTLDETSGPSTTLDGDTELSGA